MENPLTRHDSIYQVKLHPKKGQSTTYRFEQEAFEKGSHIRAYLLSSLVVLTFVGFLILDPSPNLLLALSCSANMAIMLVATYTLYKWNLLLSTVSSVFIGSGWIVFYSWGNLGARIAGDARRGGIYQGNLEYFPLVSVLSTLGLLLLVFLIFGVFSRSFRNTKIYFVDFYWDPWQAVAASILAAGILIYLSSKYQFVNGYFQDVQGIDRWFAPSISSFVNLAILVSVSVFSKGTKLSPKLLSLLLISLILILTIGIRSRTFMLITILNTGLFRVSLKPKEGPRVILIGLIVAVAIFALGTVAKMSDTGQGESIRDNLDNVSNANLGVLETQNRESVDADLQYRMAGFEFPASVLRALELGHIQPMPMDEAVFAAAQQLPSFMRPRIGVAPYEREAIYRHFTGAWIPAKGELISIPLTSGLAIWGAPLGILIYALIGLYLLIMWKIVQSSHRLFLAYLMVGPINLVGALYWDSVFSMIKHIGFAWLILLVFAPLLMPRHGYSSESRRHG